MLSINYAKKNGSGYVISFYADTVEDITNFDPTKSFGIYGIPQKGSIITLVSGTDSVNYYLGDSGEIVKIEVGGDEPTGDLTPFQIGDQIIANVTKVKFDTTISTEDMTALLSQLDYTEVDEDVYVCNLVGRSESISDFILAVAKYEGVYLIQVQDKDGAIFASEPLGDLAPVAGWNMDLLDENGEIAVGDPGGMVEYLVDTPGLNGVVYGIVEGEPTGELTPFSNQIPYNITKVVVDPSAGTSDVMDAFFAQFDDNEQTIFDGTPDLSCGVQIEEGTKIFLLSTGQAENFECIVYLDKDMPNPFTGSGTLNAYTWYLCTSETATILSEYTEIDKEAEVDYIYSEQFAKFASINGSVVGCIMGEPTSTLTPFVADQTITGIDFGNVQNGDTSDVINSLLTGLAGQYSGDGIYTLLGRSDGGGIIIFAVDLSKYNGTGYGIVVGETIVYATEANPDGDIQTTVGFQNITDGKVMLPESTQVGEPDAATASTWNGIIMGAVVSE